MTTDQFINLCDSVVPDDKFPEEPFYELSKVNIHNTLIADGLEKMPYREVLNLRTGFIYLSEIDETRDYSSYFYILEKITGYFNASFGEIASWSNPVWKDVILFVKKLPEYPKTNAFMLEEFRKQERERARAGLRLKQYGVTLSVDNNNLVVLDFENVIVRINQLTSCIGGKEGIKRLLLSLPYNKSFGRYLVLHQGNVPMMSLIEPEIPYGYLLNLFIKYLNKDTTSTHIEKDYEDLVSISTDFCLAIYNSQKMNIWNDIARMSSDVIALMHELVIRYDIYTLPQTGVSYTSDWCRFMGKWVKCNPRCTSELRSYVDYHMKLMNFCVRLSQRDKCIIISKKSKEAQLIRSIPEVFRYFLIKDTTFLNDGYNMPTDFLKVNYMMHPIYSTEDAYILLPSTIGVWCWYESLKKGVEKLEKNIGKEIGHAMEVFIRNKMQSHGVTTYSGDYSFEDVKGECDIIFQAEKGDVLIESKKKAFSRNALEGDDHFIWSELYEFFYSQMQCVRTEYGVINHSPLTIVEEGKAPFTYIWNPQYTDLDDNVRNRHIAKITMTLKEYGPMQDNILVSGLLESLLGKHIGSTFPADQYKEQEIDDFKKYFDLVNTTLDSLTWYYQRIGIAHPTHFCRFFSMEQLYYLIRHSTCADDLYKEIAEVYVSTGTQNFWNELNFRQISQQKV